MLTPNRHSTQCHWPYTLEWGCSVGPCMLIHYHIKFLFSYPKLILKFHLLYCTMCYIHCLLTYLALILYLSKIYTCIHYSVFCVYGICCGLYCSLRIFCIQKIFMFKSFALIIFVYMNYARFSRSHYISFFKTEKQGMLANNECSSWYNRVGDF